MRFFNLTLFIFLFTIVSGCTKDEEMTTLSFTPEATFRFDGEGVDYPFAYETPIIRSERSCAGSDCPDPPTVDFIRRIIFTTEDVLENGELVGTSDAVIISLNCSAREELEAFEYDFDFGFNFLPSGQIITVDLRVYDAYDFSNPSPLSARWPVDGIMILPAEKVAPREVYIDVNLGSGEEFQGTWTGRPVIIEE